MKKLFGLILLGLLVATCCLACASAKPVARTVNDVAQMACEVTFGQEELPAGITLEELCTAHENLQPFIDQILAAKNGVKAGLAPPPTPAE